MDLGGVNDGLAIALANSACPEASCCAGSLNLETVVGLLTEAGVVQSSQRAVFIESTEAQRSEALAQLLGFRALINDALEALAKGADVDDEILRRVNALLARATWSAQLERAGGGYRRTPRFAINGPADLIGPFAHSLADLLVSSDPTRVKRCREPRCTCYFVDTSKNRTRTWCSMQRCGNRQKVANYYRRSKENETAGTSVPTV